MKLKALNRIDLQKKPVQKWLKNFGLRLNDKSGGVYHKKATLEQFEWLDADLFMQAFHNVENQDGTIMFR